MSSTDEEKKPKTELTKSEARQAEGLLLLARRHVEALDEIELALAEIFAAPNETEGGRPYFGHISDAVYSNYTLAELLAKLRAK